MVFATLFIVNIVCSQPKLGPLRSSSTSIHRKQFEYSVVRHQWKRTRNLYELGGIQSHENPIHRPRKKTTEQELDTPRISTIGHFSLELFVVHFFNFRLFFLLIPQATTAPSAHERKQPLILILRHSNGAWHGDRHRLRSIASCDSNNRWAVRQGWMGMLSGGITPRTRYSFRYVVWSALTRMPSYDIRFNTRNTGPSLAVSTTCRMSMMPVLS